MKNKYINHIVKTSVPGMFVVVFGLGLSANTYAVNTGTVLSTTTSTMVASGRPYQHLKRTSRGSIEIKHNEHAGMHRTMKEHSNRPYSHIRRSPVMEQSEFAAMETGKASKQRLHRNASQGGKPYRLR